MIARTYVLSTNVSIVMWSRAQRDPTSPEISNTSGHTLTHQGHIFDIILGAWPLDYNRQDYNRARLPQRHYFFFCKIGASEACVRLNIIDSTLVQFSLRHVVQLPAWSALLPAEACHEHPLDGSIFFLNLIIPNP